MKNLCSGTHRGGFQFLLTLDLWGIRFHVVVVFGLGESIERLERDIRHITDITDHITNITDITESIKYPI